MKTKYEVHIKVDFNAYVEAEDSDEAEEKFWDFIQEEVAMPVDFSDDITDIDYDYLSAETLEAMDDC